MFANTHNYCFAKELENTNIDRSTKIFCNSILFVMHVFKFICPRLLSEFIYAKCTALLQLSIEILNQKLSLELAAVGASWRQILLWNR